jgi:serine/threonine protein kinase
MRPTGNSSLPGEYARGAIVFGRRVIERCARRNRLTSVFAAYNQDNANELFNVWSVHSGQVSHTRGSPERFSEEMSRLREVHHPSLPKIVEWDTDGDAPVILATSTTGLTLRERLKSDTYLPIDDVMEVVLAVGKVLHALHESLPNMVHLGVAPECVTLADDGEVYLEESGFLYALIASGFVSTTQAASYAQPGYVVAQELLSPPTAAADVFQLSILAFEALTGQLPFGATDPSDPPNLHAENLPSPSALRAGLSNETDEVFHKLWRELSVVVETSALDFVNNFARAVGEDRNRRPTFLGGAPGQTTQKRHAQSSNVSVGSVEESRTPRKMSLAQAIQSELRDDGVDRAFADTFDGGTAHEFSSPPVIEFGSTTTTVAPPPPASFPPSPMGVVSVKQTLTGTTTPRLSTWPPPAPELPQSVDDRPTPAVAYDRLRLLGNDIDREVRGSQSSAKDVSALDRLKQESSGDSTTRIEQELLESLRRTASPDLLQARQGRKNHDDTIPSDLPPPPTAATRPSSRPADGRAPSTIPRSKDRLPPAPRLPKDAEDFFNSVIPQSSASDGTSSEKPSKNPFVEALEEVSVVEIAPSDVVDDTSAPRVRPHAPPGSNVAEKHSPLQEREDRTQPMGTPLPPRPEAVVAMELLPPVPSKRPPPPPEHEPRHSVSEVVAKRPLSESPRGETMAVPLVAPKQTPLQNPPEEEVFEEPYQPLVDFRDPGVRDAMRYLSWSTVVAAVLVLCGLFYLRNALDMGPVESLRDEVARLRQEVRDAHQREEVQRLAVVSSVDAAVSFDASVDVTTVAVASPDATVNASVDVVLAARTDASTTVGPDVVARANLPDEAARLRVMGWMRPRINDCIEGIDQRLLVMTVRFDGTTGNVRAVHPSGLVFQEPPIGPCIEEAARSVRVNPFVAPYWDAVFRFNVPTARWRPPM